MFNISRAFALVALVTSFSGAASAETVSTGATGATGTDQTWQNPARIADIEDGDERIRAFSVLIGQSVYDEMLKADNADEPLEIAAVNIVDVTELLTAKDVLALEIAAEMNQDNIKPLQAYLELQEETKATLEEQGVLPADVVGLQRSTGGVLDVLVIPGWLTE